MFGLSGALPLRCHSVSTVLIASRVFETSVNLTMANEPYQFTCRQWMNEYIQSLVWWPFWNSYQRAGGQAVANTHYQIISREAKLRLTLTLALSPWMQTVVSLTFVSVHEILWCDFQIKSVIFLEVLSSANDYFSRLFQNVNSGGFNLLKVWSWTSSVHFGTRVHDKESRAYNAAF